MNMKPLLPGLVACTLLAGCATGPKHEVHIYPKLRELPVRTVCVFEPGFKAKVKRAMPGDLAEMKPERLAESALRISKIFTTVLSGSLTVDASCIASEDAKAWAADIAADLTTNRVPLSTKPLNVPVEAVLIIGVQGYGTENLQTQITPLFMKPIKIGKAKFQHWVQVEAILVKPQTGEVLFDVLHGDVEAREEVSADLLDDLTRRVAWVVLEAFFPKPE